MRSRRRCRSARRKRVIDGGDGTDIDGGRRGGGDGKRKKGRGEGREGRVAKHVQDDQFTSVQAHRTLGLRTESTFISRIIFPNAKNENSNLDFLVNGSQIRFDIAGKLLRQARKERDSPGKAEASSWKKRGAELG